LIVGGTMDIGTGGAVTIRISIVESVADAVLPEGVGWLGKSHWTRVPGGSRVRPTAFQGKP
jgi:hypothetical protein